MKIFPLDDLPVDIVSTILNAYIEFKSCTGGKDECLLASKFLNVYKVRLRSKERGMISVSAKQVKDMIGDGIKRPSNAEIPNKDLIRKSAYVNVKTIKKGDVFTQSLYSCKRPYDPLLISPEKIEMFFGHKFNKDKKFDDGISLSDFLC